MCLQDYLVQRFQYWEPLVPEVIGRTKYDVTLSWSFEPFRFLNKHLLYRVEKKEKVPPWVLVYCGGKTTKIIENLSPNHPHKFRLKVILKTEAVPHLAKYAIEWFGSHDEVIGEFENGTKDSNNDEKMDSVTESKGNKERSNFVDGGRGEENGRDKVECKEEIIEAGDGDKTNQQIHRHKWLESKWSAEVQTSTLSHGTSAASFCMAVKCGYIKQAQLMLEERPELIEIVNSSNGFTPLTTAVRKGDLSTVKFLLSSGADVNAPATTRQSALHLAVLGGHVEVADLLIEKGADFQARDINGLRVEHYAVDSGNLDILRFVLKQGGDVHVRDSNGWTPLFRAVCQSASTQLIEELISHGSDVAAIDNAGLSLIAVARLNKNRHGRSRDSILRLVDSQYPHEQALANFTRLTKKISSVHSLLK